MKLEQAGKIPVAAPEPYPPIKVEGKNHHYAQLLGQDLASSGRNVGYLRIHFTALDFKRASGRTSNGFVSDCPGGDAPFKHFGAADPFIGWRSEMPVFFRTQSGGLEW